MSVGSGEPCIDRRLDLCDPEWEPADLRQRLGVHQELVAKHGLELAHVQLRYEDISEALQQSTHVVRPRPNVSDMDVGDVLAGPNRPPDGLVDRTEGRAPADHRKFRASASEADFLVGDRLGNSKDLADARVGHLLVGGGRVVDVTGPRLLFDTADAMLQPGGTRLDPRPCEVLIARIGDHASPSAGGVSKKATGKGW